MKKRFLVEIDVPENTGDLCWDEDETGLQAFHDCIISDIPKINLNWLIISEKSDCDHFKRFIHRKNSVRSSFKIIKDIKN